MVAVGGGDDDDESWMLPELRNSLLELPLFKYTLTPASAPVFMKYRQAELDQLVGEVMKFLLARASGGVVTPHKDLLTLIGDRAKGGATSILADARRRFMTMYGWELREIDKTTEAVTAPTAAAAAKKRKSAGAAPAAAASAAESGAAGGGGGGGGHGTKSYILSVHPSCARTMGMARAFNFGVGEWAEGDGGGGEDDEEQEQQQQQQPGAPSQAELHKGLLFFILALCYTEERNPANQHAAGGGGARGAAGGAAAAAGGAGAFAGVSATKLWKSLHKCDPHMKEKQKAHPVFGNVAEVIDDLVKQQSATHPTTRTDATRMRMLGWIVCFHSLVFSLLGVSLSSYLDRVKVSVPDPNDADAPPHDEIAYRIGARGRAEISTKSIYEGMCKVSAHTGTGTRRRALTRSPCAPRSLTGRSLFLTCFCGCVCACVRAL